MAVLVTSLPPSPYRTPYIDQLTLSTEGSWVMGAGQSLTRLEARATYGTWDQIEPLLKEIEAGEHAFFARIARVEFAWNESSDPWHTQVHGAVLFDASGAVVCYISNALLGYEGHGPRLSLQILHLLGVPLEMFQKMQRITHDSRPYVVVFSRETPGNPEGTDEQIVTHDEPLREWRCWRAR